MKQFNIKILGLSLLLSLVSACASDKVNLKANAPAQTASPASNEIPATQAKATLATPISPSNEAFDSRVGSALTSPLSDFNLLRTEIPEILLIAKRAPYSMPKEVDCAWLEAEIAVLNKCLGPDVDAVRVDEQGNIMDKGSAELGNATVNALRSFTEGFVPFRSWIRRLTGADSHAKEVAAAGISGVIRRAFLKGVAQAKMCPNSLPNNEPSDTKNQIKEAEPVLGK